MCGYKILVEDKARQISVSKRIFLLHIITCFAFDKIIPWLTLQLIKGSVMRQRLGAVPRGCRAQLARGMSAAKWRSVSKVGVVRAKVGVAL